MRKLYTITYGGREIQFILELSKRKTLCIKVEPNSSITVKAPKNQNIDNILHRVEKKAPWIVKQLAYFDSLPEAVMERQYIE